MYVIEKKDEIPLPKNWAPMKGEKVKLVSLSPDCSEYKKVAQHFGGRAAIKKVCDGSMYENAT